MKETFISKDFSDGHMAIIDRANEIIEEYQADGYTLTLRQLYYQFVARGLLANEQRKYKNLGSIISDARLAGLVDWYAIEDRTRYLRGNTHWDAPSDIIRGAANGFKIDKWDTQPCRVEVWIEKDALLGVIESVCRELDVDYFACRGYSSQSEQWRAGKRFARYVDAGQRVIVFHFGDHDPSGIDMTRDNQDRLNLFSDYGCEVRRLALNMDQVEEHNPPPNPTKLTDSRAGGYVSEHGYESWELDALEPRILADLVRENVLSVRDEDAWDRVVEEEERGQERLRDIADNWSDVLTAWDEWNR